MSGMTLAETLLCLVLSLGILGSVIHFSGGVAQAHFETRLNRLHNMNLGRSRDQIQEAVAKLEPSFWQAFPAIQDAVHEHSQHGSGWSYSQSCGQFLSGSCLTLYDIEPINYEHVHELNTHTYPAWIQFTDEMPILKDGDLVVWMVCDADNSYCLLTQNFSGTFWIIAEPHSLWAIPEIQAEDFEWILLGKLIATHFYLDKSDRRGKSLYEEVLFYDEGWQDRRSRSSFQYLEKMNFESAGFPHLVLQGVSGKESYVYFSP